VETEPQLIEQYIRTGQARLVYRHLLQLGDGSRVLAEANECAGEQGRFWEMRELLYREQDRVFAARDFGSVQPLAAQLGLDETAMQQCMDSGQFRAQVEADNAAAGREGVTSRPVMDINGQRLVGALPLPQFQQVIEAAQP
jgi:protein-disulfide isomerase